MVRKEADKGQITEGNKIVLVPNSENDSEKHLYDRKKLLELTGELIAETHDRISGERFRVRDGDRERLAYLRTLRDLIALEASLLKDAHAPALEGISHFTEVDHELEEARTREMNNLERGMYGLPPLPVPVKRR